MTGNPHAAGRPGTGEELRIAVVMNGGVSLAVWIGGVTLELGRLVAGDSAYGELQKLVGTSARVDVICGTSAGGINGAFLAMALAYCPSDLVSKLRELRDLWVSKGSIGSLLRSPFAQGATSILDGDGFFYESLRNAFHSLKTTTPTNPERVPIELLITTTLLEGIRRDHADDFGNHIVDVNHRGRFRFSRGRTGEPDQFAAADIADQLALAARSTASFPAAFEASFCPVNETRVNPTRPNMKDVANFDTSQFVIDGGVLDNSPLDLALDSIFHQRAHGPVRRVLAFVIPDPATTAGDQAKAAAGTSADAEKAPELLDVALASLVQIPAVQSISGQLDQLREHNKRARGRRESRVLLTQNKSPEEIDRLAEMLFSTYRDQRTADAVEYILDEISKGLVEKSFYGLGRRGRREWLRRAISGRKEQLPWVPTRPPTESSTERSPDKWRWGTRPAEHMVHVLLDIVIRTQRVAVLRSMTLHIEQFWTAAYDLLQTTERARAADKDYWRGQADKVLEVLGEGKTRVMSGAIADKWISGALRGWKTTSSAEGTTPYRESAEILYGIADQLLALRATISNILGGASNEADPLVCEQAHELDRLFHYFVRTDGDSPDRVVGRLLAFEVTQDALGGRGTVTEQEVGFIEISARSQSTFGGPAEPTNKLAGIQLAHFGAFYKESWRANDWLWGRLDTVHRLVRLLLDPERLRIVAGAIPGRVPKASTMAASIREIAVNAAYPTLSVELARMFDASVLAQLTAELAYLDDHTMPVPEHLPIAVEVISRRLEGEILSKELRLLAEAIENDHKAKCHTSEAAQSFLTRCESVCTAGTVPGDEIRGLFSLCTVGSERLAAEVGTDHLTVVATQAVAVGISSVHNQKGLLALVARLSAAIRMPALLFYLLARNVYLRSRTGAAVDGALVAAGTVIVLTAAYYRGSVYNSTMIFVGVALVAGPFIWAIMHWPRTAGWIVAVLIAILLLLLYFLFLFIFLYFLGVLSPPDLPIQVWQNIAFGSVGLLVIALIFGARS